MGATYLYVNDSGANTWQVAVDDSGILSSESVAPAAPAAIYLNDYETNATSWLLGVQLTGELTMTSQVYSAAYPCVSILHSPSDNKFALSVTDQGLLVTIVAVVLDAVTAAPAGVLIRITVKVLAGITATSAGALVRTTLKPFVAATAAAAGVLVTSIIDFLTLTASTAVCAGTLVKTTIKPLVAASAAFAGTLVRITVKPLAAATAAAAGTLVAHIIDFLVLTASSAAFAGSLVRATAKQLVAVSAAGAGALVKTTIKIFPAGSGGLTQGPNSPGTMAIGTVGYMDWINPDNAKISDDIYTTSSLTQAYQSEYLIASNYGFTIPDGAQIDGILDEWEVQKTGPGEVQENTCKIWRGGAKVGTEQRNVTPWTGVDTYLPSGGAANKWGLIWTAAQINDPTTGGLIDVREQDVDVVVAKVDHVRRTVYYTPAACVFFAAVLARTVTKPLAAATATAAAVLAKVIIKPLAAATAASAGALVRTTRKILTAASAAMAGVLVKGTQKILAGASAACTATLQKTTTKVLAASSVAWSGVLIRSTVKILSATTAQFTAALHKTTTRFFSAVTALYAGALTAHKITFVGFAAATAAFAGGIVKTTVKVWNAVKSAWAGVLDIVKPQPLISARVRVTMQFAAAGLEALPQVVAERIYNHD